MIQTTRDDKLVYFHEDGVLLAIITTAITTPRLEDKIISVLNEPCEGDDE